MDEKRSKLKRQQPPSHSNPPDEKSPMERTQEEAAEHRETERGYQ